MASLKRPWTPNNNDNASQARKRNLCWERAGSQTQQSDRACKAPGNDCECGSQLQSGWQSQGSSSLTTTPTFDILADGDEDSKHCPEAHLEDFPPLGPESPPTEGEIASPDCDQICFGLICDTKAQFLDNPRIAEETDILAQDTPDLGFYRLHLFPREQHFALQFRKAIDIAIIDTKTSNTLRKLVDFTSLRYEIFVAVDEFLDKIRSWKNIGKGAIMAVEINVYGAKHHSRLVGKLLSKGGLFLQHPRYCDSGVRYDNPQVIGFSQLPSSGIELPTPFLSTGAYSDPPQVDMMTVFDDLHQSGCLQITDIDERITTRLLSHQREGVNFIEQREAENLPTSFSLWEFRQEKGNRRFYQHSITGHRKPTIPDEASGGILADAMGLGKSLTILAAVTGSLHRAANFVLAEKQNALMKQSCTLAAKSTLVIAPSVLLLEGWIEEIRLHVVEGSLQIYKYHGSGRDADNLSFLDYDIIFTTYATVSADFCRGSSSLHRVKWFRIVLDEAHTIRHQHTKQFRAVAGLVAKHRWCLTGTPIQNKLDDLGSLVRFLRVPLLDTPSSFRNAIINPIETDCTQGFRNLRILLKSTCLRRTKDLLHLPEPVQVEYNLRLSSAETTKYEIVGEDFRQAIDAAVSCRNTAKGYQGILQALLRLRLLCNHGTIESSTNLIDGSTDLEDMLAILQQSDEAICAYCHSEIRTTTDLEPQAGSFTKCMHLLCVNCMVQYRQDCENNKEDNAQCHLCDPHTQPMAKSLPNAEIQTCTAAVEGYSSKLTALIMDIEKHRFEAKSIVFSFWKKTLLIIASLFENRRLPFVLIDGSVSLADRTKFLAQFKNDSSIPILLMTLGTGAVGLNLAIASRIHIIEPQWNPSMESQAIGRALRLGQEKQVTVIRYIMQGTVEKYIQSRQARKLQLAEIGWNNADDQEEQKLKRLLELRQLLDGKPQET